MLMGFPFIRAHGGGQMFAAKHGQADQENQIWVEKLTLSGR
jgi:hypothetical protein